MKKILIVIFLFSLKFTIYSQNSSYTEIKDLKILENKIEANTSKINTIISDFVQEKKLDYLDATITSKGKFWFKKSNFLRWEYFEPYKYLIVINAGKFYIKNESKVSVYDVNTNKVFKEVNDLLISMVQGNIMFDKKFHIDAFENKTLYLLKLVPIDSNMKKIIAKTKIYIDKNDFSVVKVVMEESETDYTIISFVNRRFNENISDNIFNIK